MVKICEGIIVFNAGKHEEGTMNVSTPKRPKAGVSVLDACFSCILQDAENKLHLLCRKKCEAKKNFDSQEKE